MFGQVIPCDIAYSPPAMVLDVEIALPDGERHAMRGVIDSGADFTVVNEYSLEYLQRWIRGLALGAIPTP